MGNEQSPSPHGQSPLYVSIQTSQRGISAVYIKVRPGNSVKTEEFDADGDIILDLDAAEDLVGVEILSLTPSIKLHMQKIAHQYHVPDMMDHFHPENISQVFA